LLIVGISANVRCTQQPLPKTRLQDEKFLERGINPLYKNGLLPSLALVVLSYVKKSKYKPKTTMVLTPTIGEKSYNRQDWQKGYQSQPNEYDYEVEDIEGQIPPDLQGTVFKNGTVYSILLAMRSLIPLMGMV
jgi:hypothetical protein